MAPPPKAPAAPVWSKPPIPSGIYSDRYRTPAQAMQPKRKSLMRKYEVAALTVDNKVHHSEHIAPASPDFEGAFSAFARGTMIATPSGPRAIEDIEPGTLINTVGGPALPVLWVGSMTLVPSAPIDRPEQLRLTRIMADTFGLARPMPDLLLGHGARLLRSPAALREYAMQTDVLTPAWAFVDGSSAIAITPPAPVALYHLCLPHHAIISAAGLEVESYHPGTMLLRDMGPSTRALFLSLFPHVTREDGFGPLSYPRAAQNTLEQLDLV
ncbi:Hint domain-containing protein [Marimonas arenosa]|uniref:Hint domain-containing protein n=1 Tax=Marimonas arenosa TaxID=1795305 RepID=A0AAE4B3I9_9RHOB|nr:Hint domain-containing protein [Marimonas arenosa]MDQ2090108.1 Hint domain-containing protein [Marimonas arenosa]